MAENSNNKTNNSFFKDIIKTVKDFDKYEDFALEGVKKSIVYILKIIAIFALVVTIVSIYQFSKGVNQAINYFNENISNLDYADGILQINNFSEFKFIDPETNTILAFVNEIKNGKLVPLLV